MTQRSVPFSFFFKDTATTEIYTLSLHDALPIPRRKPKPTKRKRCASPMWGQRVPATPDRKSKRLKSSHRWISYAVFCFKKKTQALHYCLRIVLHDTISYKHHRDTPE